MVYPKVCTYEDLAVGVGQHIEDGSMGIDELDGYELLLYSEQKLDPIANSYPQVASKLCEAVSKLCDLQIAAATQLGDREEVHRFTITKSILSRKYS